MRAGTSCSISSSTPPGRRLTGAPGGAFAAAAEQARELGHHYVRPEHLILLLAECGAEPAAVRDQVMRMLLEQSPELVGSLGRMSWLSRVMSKRY